MGAWLIPYEEVSRESIGALDVAGVKMVCISYLDIKGSPAHLRYLLQRLRERLPRDTPILVGLWPTSDSALRDPKVRNQIGANYLTTSLAEAVSACADAALKVGGKVPQAEAA